MAVRVTQFVEQVVSSDNTEIRVTQMALQVAATDDTEIRVSQMVLQVASTGSLDAVGIRARTGAIVFTGYAPTVYFQPTVLDLDPDPPWVEGATGRKVTGLNFGS